MYSKKSLLYMFLCTLTLSIIIYYMYVYRYTDKRGVKHYFGEKCILGGMKYTISYIKVYENRCASVHVPIILFAIGSYRVHMFNRVNIIHL